MQQSIVITVSPQELKELMLEAIKESNKDSKKENNKLKKPLNVAQAAEFLGWAKPTLYAYTSERKIPYSKRGGKLYFDEDELIEWLQQGKQKTQAEIQAEAQNYVKNAKGGKNGKY